MIPSRLLHGLSCCALLVGCGDSEPSSTNPERTADAAQSNDAGADTAVPADAPPEGGSLGNVPGRHDHTLVVEDETREVIVYVPELARGNARAPVVVMFHGTSGDGEKFFNISGWREKADREGLIAVFPSALTYCFLEDENRDGDFADQGERKVTTKWNSGVLDDRLPLCSPAEIAALPPGPRALADHPLRDDVAYVAAILALLGSEYVIEEQRVYATGFSNGGSFTSRLAVDMSDRFAAIASASGFLAVEPVPAKRPLPVALWLGNEDDRFIGTGPALPVDESLLTLPFYQALIAKYLVVLSLADSHTFDQSAVGGRQIGRFVYSQSTTGGSNELDFAVVEGLQHQYPNGTNHPMVAADVLWNFFSAYTLP